MVLPAVDYLKDMNKVELYVIRPLTVSGLKHSITSLQKLVVEVLLDRQMQLELGMSRAICKMNPEAKPALRKENLVTRDPREVERKKYNHVKARKKPQFSKR